MAQWKYTIKSGKALREAIDEGDTMQTVECLLKCYEELRDKLSDEDNVFYEDYEEYEYDIADNRGMLMLYQLDPDEYDEEDIDNYLAEFYDICDNVRAWISM